MTLRTSFRLAALSGALAAATALTGCAPLLLGGAMIGGSMMATDRRSSGTQIDDQAIELKATNRARDILGDRGHVNATSYNRMVLLTGEVPTEDNKAAIEQSVSKVDNVRHVVNELAVTTASSLSSRSNDAFLTSKVKATLVDAGDISANAFKVLTERGVVYLMGRVTEREASRAVALARTISGVQKVVRVFDLLSEAELAELQPRNAPKTSPGAATVPAKP